MKHKNLYKSSNMANTQLSRGVLKNITTKIKNKIKTHNFKEYVKVKAETTNEHDNLKLPLETELENQYTTIRDSIVFEEDLKHVMVDLTSKTCVEHKAETENHFSFRDSIIFKEELPLDDNEFQEIKKEPSDKEIKSPPSLIDLGYQQSFKNAIVFKEDLDDLYEDHTFKEEDEMIIGPQVFQQAVDLRDADNKVVHTGNSKSNNKKQKQIYTGICGIKSSQKKWFDKHACMKKNVFVCDHCERRFDTKRLISRHMKTHKRIDQKRDSITAPQKEQSRTTQKQHLCNICNKVFSFKGNLQRHLKKMHLGTAKIFECNICSKTYTSKEQLQYHITNQHLDSPNREVTCRKCRYCDKLLNKSYCNRHERWYCLSNPKALHPRSRKKTRIMTCNICQKTYLDKDSLTCHIKLHKCVKANLQELKVQCDLCSQKFTRKYNLKCHMQAKHLNVNSFVCTLCNKGFVRKWSLTHHQEKPCRKLQQNNKESDKIAHRFKCHLCSCKYKNKSGLQMHMEAHHLLKKFLCQYCQAKYSRKWSRDSHEKKCQWIV